MKKLVVVILSANFLILASEGFADPKVKEVETYKRDEITYLYIRGAQAEIIFNRLNKAEEKVEPQAKDELSTARVLARISKSGFRCWQETRLVTDKDNLKNEQKSYQCSVGIKNTGDLYLLERERFKGE